MTIQLDRPSVAGLNEVVGALGDWQRDGAPGQLHPGDLGWFWRFGADATAAAVRTWSHSGQLLAVGLMDGPTLRLAIAPAARQDETLARQLAADLTAHGPLTAGAASVEAPAGSLVREVLGDEGWVADEPWTSLGRDLTAPVEDAGVRVDVTGADRAGVRTALQRASFGSTSFTEDRWQVMATGPLYKHARCLVAYDDQGDPVAAMTVWATGPGKPGLIEPMGVHPEHRGHGYGRAITLAGAATLGELGSSSAIVCTPSSNVGAVATYIAGGLRPLAEVHDLRRPLP